MNAQIPTAEQFLAQHEPDEDDVQYVDEQWQGQLGPLMLLPTDPMERVAAALERLADCHTKPIGEQFTAELSSVEGDGHNPAACPVEQEYADLEAKHQTVLQVISDVEAALGKSKAAPALAAKAVIEAWRNPQVPETEEPEGEDEVLVVDSGTGEHVEAPAAYVAEQSNTPEPEPSQVNEGHTRVPHPDGFDFCQECSGNTQQWVHWPCPQLPAPNPEPVAIEPAQPQQPEHNAPVEEWREYARALGYAGPEIDKANRSMIRTTLGVVQPTEGGA